jgi:hypothetical protein
MFIATIIIIADRTNNLYSLFATSFAFFNIAMIYKMNVFRGVTTTPETPSIPLKENIEIRINEIKESQPKVYAKYQTFLGVRRSLENDLGLSLS